MRAEQKLVPNLWMSVAATAIFLAGCLIGHQAGLLRLGVPACAVLIGISLYATRPSAYIQFTLWMWFLSPFFRRVIDYRFGYADQNFVLLTPILVTIISSHSLTKIKFVHREALPFLLCIAGILYGLVIGVLLNPSSDLFYGLFNWISPVLLGLFLYIQWPLLIEHRRAIERTLLLGGLVMGAYGIYQYCNPPKWDVFWWESLPYSVADSFGRPLKFEVRVWSTLNAPAPFAGVMGTVLLLNHSSASKWKWLCTLAGVGALALSLSRTEWVGFAIAVMFMLYRSGRANLPRFLAGLAVLVVGVAALYAFAPTDSVVGQRLASFQHLSQDESVQTRSAMYSRLMGDVVRNPFGHGVTSATTYDGYALDSGPLRFLLKLGVLGTLFYAAGLCLICSRLLPKHSINDPLQVACAAVVVSALVKFISLSAFEGAPGALLWLSIGIGLASQRFHSELQTPLTVSEEYAYAD